MARRRLDHWLKRKMPLLKTFLFSWRPRLSMLISMLVAVMIMLALVLALWLFVSQQRSALEQAEATRVTDLARVVAAKSAVRAALASSEPGADDTSGALQRDIDGLRRALGIDLIVVMTPESRRLTHSDPGLVGRRFQGNDEGPALAGDHYASRSQGTLGTSIRGFSPVYDEDGEVIGAVAVGVTLASVHEGILAVDREGCITLANDAARSLFTRAGLGEPPLGAPLTDYIAHTSLPTVLTDMRPALDRELLINGRVLLVNRVPIRHAGQMIGAVATLRDKSEVARLAEELTGVHRYAEALRASTHDFKNKLHVITGLTKLGDLDALRRYLRELADSRLASSTALGDEFQDPVLAGFLLGKRSEARERGIELAIIPTSPLPIPRRSGAGTYPGHGDRQSARERLRGAGRKRGATGQPDAGAWRAAADARGSGYRAGYLKGEAGKNLRTWRIDQGPSAWPGAGPD